GGTWHSSSNRPPARSRQPIPALPRAGLVVRARWATRAWRGALAGPTGPGGVAGPGGARGGGGDRAGPGGTGARRRATGPGGAGDAEPGMRWLMASDVCKHCTHAACLDVCPTGSLFRTEFGTVVVQDDICNGCGYCVSACPYGVIERRGGDGRAVKCTPCYGPLRGDPEPALPQALPTPAIPVRTAGE